MKKIYAIAAFVLLTTLAFAQRVPQGMKYQAVARDLKGQVLADQTLTLRINLISGSTKAALVHYSETHEVTTNQFGLFTLVVGEGKIQAGMFDRVPWSSEDIWMEVGIREGGKSQFATISSSKLLAVPYAFHAATAAELVGKSSNPAGAKGDVNRDQPGVVSQNWSVFGNMRTVPTRDVLGTTDYQDLVMITNNIERLRITKDGDINIAKSLKVGNDVEVGNDLTVKQDVFLNTVGGATINNGPLNVKGPTDLDNTLNVDGIATISNPTQSSSKTNGALVVVGGVGIGKNLNVGGNTDLDGTLNVDGNTTIQGITNVTNSTQATNTTTGALTVAGGVGIGKNINIGGDASIGGNTTLGGKVNITDLTESTSTTTGALVVAGGVGIGKRINVGGAAQLNSTLGVDGAADMNSTLNADGATTLKSTLAVDGATDLNSNLNVDGTTTHNAKVTIDADVNGDQGDDNSYPLVVKGSNQGIVIEVDGSRDNGNNFVTFRDDNGIQGRIEGQTVTEVEDSDEYKTQVTLLTIQTVSLAADIVGLGVEAVGLIAGVFSAGAAIGVGAQVVSAGVALAAYGIELANFLDYAEANAGVSYASGNGDYAEWLERGEKENDMVFGQIVGVKGGKLSLRTEVADHYMVISKSPIVLGNMPVASREKYYEKVAFMGQVPVRVVGKVAIGDYIIPSGNHDGKGIAVHPADMKLGDYAHIVGVSWQAANGLMPFSYVNVAVGINANDLTRKLLQQQAEIDELKGKTDEMKGKMNGLMSYLKTKDANFNAELYALPAGSQPMTPAPAVANNPSPSMTASAMEKTINSASFSELFAQQPELLTKSMAMAKQQFEKQGIDVNKHPYLKQLLTDPQYLKATADQLQGRK